MKMETKRIMCIDPASVSSGWAVAEQNGTLIASGTILAPKGASLPLRMWLIFSSTLEVVKKYNPKIVVIEQMSKKTHHAVNMAIGVALAVCGKQNIYADASLVPGQWKAHWGIKVPRGEKKTEYVRAAFARNYPLLVGTTSSDDEVEAILMVGYLSHLINKRKDEYGVI